MTQKISNRARFLPELLATILTLFVLSAPGDTHAQDSQGDQVTDTEIEPTCESEDPATCAELGWSRFGQNRDNPASRHLAIACLKESGVGCFRLGEYHLFVGKAPKKAFDVYFEACRSGYTTGCAAWTVLNLYGEKTTNKEWALETVEMVEEEYCKKQQDGESCWWTGQLYQAIGDDMDKAKMYKKQGFELLEKDCAKGKSSSCRMLKLLMAGRSK
jgi:TPR repeat protein